MVIKDGRAAWSHAGALHGGTPSPPRIAAEPPSRVGAFGDKGSDPLSPILGKPQAPLAFQPRDERTSGMDGAEDFGKTGMDEHRALAPKQQAKSIGERLCQARFEAADNS